MKSKLVWGLRLISAAILLQTLFFKFTGAPESKFIFSTLGVEPFGRYFAGLSELIASHIAFLGIVVQDDGGLLFILACVVLVSSSLIVFLERQQIPIWIKRIQKQLRRAGTPQ